MIIKVNLKIIYSTNNQYSIEIRKFTIKIIQNPRIPLLCKLFNNHLKLFVMKNLLKTTLLLALLAISSASYSDNIKISLKPYSYKQKSLVFSTNEAEKVDLSIYNVYDGVLYKESIKSEKPVTKVYNLDSFPEGHYIVKLVRKDKTIEYEVKITRDKALVSAPYVSK